MKNVQQRMLNQSPASSATPEPAGSAPPCPPGAVRPGGEAPRCHTNAAAHRGRLARLIGPTGPHVYASEQLLQMAHCQSDQPTGKFFPANYIPALADYPKGLSGSAIANPHTGAVIGARDSKATVTAQSTTKLYMAALLMMLERGEGEAELFATVGRQASDDAFNADSRMQDPEHAHLPLNPFINIGALATTNRVREILQQRQHAGPAAALGPAHPEDVLVDLLRELTGNDAIYVDEAIAESERQTGDNNRRLLGIVIAARDGRLDRHGAPYPSMEQQQVDDAAANYFRQCAIKMSPQDHAKALWALEHKINPLTGQTYLTHRQLEVLKDLTQAAGNYNQSAQLRTKSHDGAIAKSGVGGTQIGWIRSHKTGQPDIPFGVISEGLNAFGNPKAGTSWLGFMGRQNIHFRASNPLKSALQRSADLRPGAVYLPTSRPAPKAVSEQLLGDMLRSDEAFLKQQALADMDDAGRQRVHDRSETGFYLKMAKHPEHANARKLLVARDLHGVMKTYSLVPEHHQGGHGDQRVTIGAAKVVVAVTPDADPYRRPGGQA